MNCNCKFEYSPAGSHSFSLAARKHTQTEEGGRERKTDRQMGRQTDRQTDRGRERETDRGRETDRQTDRQRDKDRDTETDRGRKRINIIKVMN